MNRVDRGKRGTKAREARGRQLKSGLQAREESAARERGIQAREVSAGGRHGKQVRDASSESKRENIHHNQIKSFFCLARD